MAEEYGPSWDKNVLRYRFVDQRVEVFTVGKWRGIAHAMRMSPRLKADIIQTLRTNGGLIPGQTRDPELVEVPA
jgi:hypothetical protein